MKKISSIIELGFINNFIPFQNFSLLTTAQCCEQYDEISTLSYVNNVWIHTAFYCSLLYSKMGHVTICGKSNAIVPLLLLLSDMVHNTADSTCAGWDCGTQLHWCNLNLYWPDKGWVPRKTACPDLMLWSVLSCLTFRSIFSSLAYSVVWGGILSLETLICFCTYDGYQTSLTTIWSMSPLNNLAKK